MRRPAPARRFFALLAALLLAACAAPPPSPAAATDATSPAVAPRPTPAAQPAGDNPLQEATDGDVVQVDRSCKTNADCAVKDVGNCCGRFPACVNKDSPTDPKAVQAQCQAKGIASVCGYREISSCECVAGTCQAPAQERRLRHGVPVER